MRNIAYLYIYTSMLQVLLIISLKLISQINSDYMLMYPGSKNSIFDEIEEFCDKIIPIFVEEVKDATSKNIIQALKDSKDLSESEFKSNTTFNF